MSEITAGIMLERALMQLVRWASRADVRRELLGSVAPDLSPTDIWLLGAIDEKGPVRVSDLAAWQGVDKSTVSPQLRRLESQGLVRRQDDPADRRVVLLSITDRGQTLREGLGVQGAAVFDRLLQDWTAEDREALASLMGRLSHTLSMGMPAGRTAAAAAPETSVAELPAQQ